MISQPAQPSARTVHLAEFNAPSLLARHPEGASTPCQCSAPEPCYRHGDLIADRAAPTVCQCIAPEPCRVHPDDRPWIKRPPAWVRPPATSTVGRLEQRPEPGGVLLEVEARTRLPKFTDDDVAMLTRLISAEQRRRGIVGGAG